MLISRTKTDVIKNIGIYAAVCLSGCVFVLLSASWVSPLFRDSYGYDSSGLRLYKGVNWNNSYEEHFYVWQGSRIISERCNDTELEFFYHESGSPYALLVRDTSAATPTEAWYYYVTNLQGDVVMLLDSSGTVMAEYSYNAWGLPLSATGTMAELNPIRYRGYYYDAETGFYYLQSRYYDPVICWFLNADGYASTGQGVLGCNMFAYCGNEPVEHYDCCGSMAGKTEISVCSDTVKQFVYYYSIEEAAFGFGKKYFRKAMLEGVEYGADIVAIHRGGTIMYYLSKIISGDNVCLDDGKCLLQKGFAGSVHIHVPGPDNDGDHFSPRDETTMDKILGEDYRSPYEFYLICPNCTVLGYGYLDNGEKGAVFIGILHIVIPGGKPLISITNNSLH